MKSVVHAICVVQKGISRQATKCEEFIPFTPPDTDALEWQNDLRDMATQLTESCRKIDPTCTDEVLQSSHANNDAAV